MATYFNGINIIRWCIYYRKNEKINEIIYPKGRLFKNDDKVSRRAIDMEHYTAGKTDI